jgi:hypothetical protein
MPRTISLNLRNALYAQNTNEVPVVLIKLWATDVPGTVIRISTDPTTLISTAPQIYGTLSGGAWHYFYPIMVQLPDIIDERAPTAKLAIENVSRDMVSFVRNMAAPGKCDIKVVLAATPNTIEIDYPDFDILSSQYNESILSIEVGLNALDQEPFPAGLFTPAGFPGLFG